MEDGVYLRYCSYDMLCDLGSLVWRTVKNCWVALQLTHAQGIPELPFIYSSPTII